MNPVDKKESLQRFSHILPRRQAQDSCSLCQSLAKECFLELLMEQYAPVNKTQINMSLCTAQVDLNAISLLMMISRTSLSRLTVLWMMADEAGYPRQSDVLTYRREVRRQQFSILSAVLIVWERTGPNLSDCYDNSRCSI